jgi:hypothetical protein
MRAPYAWNPLLCLGARHERLSSRFYQLVPLAGRTIRGGFPLPQRFPSPAAPLSIYGEG